MEGENKVQKRIKNYRIFLCIFLGMSLMGLVYLYYYGFYCKIPNSYRLPVYKEETLEFTLPVSAKVCKVIETNKNKDIEAIEAFNGQNVMIETKATDTLVFKADKTENYKVNLKLFGLIPIKDMSLEVVNETQVYPVGKPIGIYVKTNGVLVIGVGSVNTSNGTAINPSKNIIKGGDYIFKINEQTIDNKKQLIKAVSSCKGEDLIVTLRRKDEVFQVKIKPVLDNQNTYKIGLWIRDSAQGIGTLTFYDANGNFGALGHGINDIDTNTLMEMENGSVYMTDIVAVRKGEQGNPGELTGIIDFKNENRLGEIIKNTNVGIYGNLENIGEISSDIGPMPIGLKQQLHIGEAQILCEIDGESKLYDAIITEINYDNDNSNRGIVLKITDEKLINLTGGIVQGMSGAPIIQDGKLVGAVTHVFVNDACKGYGVFIENMVLMR